MARDEPSKSKGTMDEIKGKAKQAMGDVTDNPRQREEGKQEERAGKGDQARAELEKRDRGRV